MEFLNIYCWMAVPHKKRNFWMFGHDIVIYNALKKLPLIVNQCNGENAFSQVSLAPCKPPHTENCFYSSKHSIVIFLLFIFGGGRRSGEGWGALSFLCSNYWIERFVPDLKMKIWRTEFIKALSVMCIHQIWSQNSSHWMRKKFMLSEQERPSHQHSCIPFFTYMCEQALSLLDKFLHLFLWP